MRVDLTGCRDPALPARTVVSDDGERELSLKRRGVALRGIFGDADASARLGTRHVIRRWVFA